jgi:hypothetical protein
MVTGHDGDPTAQRWPLRGFWRAWYWISWVISAALVVVGLGTMILVWWLPSVPLLLVGALVGWQLGRTARLVTLGADGTLTLRRVPGTVHTNAARVQRVRPSALVSSFTPTVVETADGWVYLIHTRSDRDDLIDAIRRHNPAVEVHI